MQIEFPGPSVQKPTGVIAVPIHNMPFFATRKLIWNTCDRTADTQAPFRLKPSATQLLHTDLLALGYETPWPNLSEYFCSGL